MGRGSTAKVGLGSSSNGKGYSRAYDPLQAAKSRNNISPFGLRAQRNLSQQLQVELRRLADLGKSAKDQGDLLKQLDEAKKTFKEIQKLSKGVDKYLKASLEKDRSRLEGVYKGKVSRNAARYATDLKRTYEKMHPGKTIKMPKGATQREFRDAIEGLSLGGKWAKPYKQYVVKAPKRRKP